MCPRPAKKLQNSLPNKWRFLTAIREGAKMRKPAPIAGFGVRLCSLRSELAPPKLGLSNQIIEDLMAFEDLPG